MTHHEENAYKTPNLGSRNKKDMCIRNSHYSTWEIQDTRDTRYKFIFPNWPYINTPKQMNMDTKIYTTINKRKTGISVP